MDRETLKCSLRKAVCLVDALIVCNSDQLCTGLQCGIKVAIHTMNEPFDSNCLDSFAWCVLLVDTSNTFNLL